MLHLNNTPAPKPRLNSADMAEVNAAAPSHIRQRTPLPILATHLYGLAFRKPRLIEEVEAVLAEETARREQPTMRVVR